MDKYQEILQKYWGYPDFRHIQRQVIESIGAGRDTLGLMPTGGGKSLCFQVPAMTMQGVCVVITPLISLMKDQVDHLRTRGLRAAAIYSGLSHQEIVQTLDNAVYGGLKFLYVAPERLSSQLFRIKLSHMKVCFVTVDEAHCISQWGYDFRPSYLQIATIRDIQPDAPILALTATATPDVINDIQEQLHFHEKNVLRMSFERKNLSYVVRHCADKMEMLHHILTHTKGSTIIYTRSRQATKDVARLLERQGFSATFYHAGLDTAVKEQRQDDWQHDKVRIMVATNAFGMGIDKADVGLVVHLEPPNSLEEYFQEAGRAGRNGKRAYAVLLTDKGDVAKLRRRISTTFPEKEKVREVYERLAYFFEVGVGSGGGVTYDFSLADFCKAYRYSFDTVEAALIILQRAGYLRYDPDPDNQLRLRFLLTRDDLYRLHETSEEENRVIMALLRHYEGLFADYVFIDELRLATEAQMDQQQVYQLLKDLSKQRIISFIPRRSLPRIRYERDRVDGCDVVITPEVYERRKEQLTKRIGAIILYCAEHGDCRSQQLLRYFGEDDAPHCGHCDVCLDKHHDTKKHDQALALAEQQVLALLADQQPHSLSEVKGLDLDPQVLSEVLNWLVSENKIKVESDKISLA